MNLDALKLEWAARDAPIDALLRLNTRLLQEAFIDRHAREIRKLDASDALELVLWIPTSSLAALFLVSVWGEWRFVVPGLALFAWLAIFPALTLQQRHRLLAIDFGRPPLAVLEEVERLRIVRVKTFRWALLTGQVVWWIPLLVVLSRGVLGVDVFRFEGWQPFMVASLAAGLTFIPAALVASRLLSGRFGSRGWFQAIVDDIAGRDIVAARDFLAKLAALADGREPDR